MKKIILFTIAVSLLFTWTSCSDEDYNSKYIDPSKVTEPQVPNLMNGVLQRAKAHSTYGYRRYFGVSSQFTGKLAQTFGYATGSSMYEPGYNAYVEEELNLFYMAMSDYVKLCQLYDELNDVGKQAYEAYKLGAMIHLYDWALSCVDWYGNIPFSKACRLPITGDIVSSYASYDEASDIYSTILDDLKVAAERFAGSDMGSHNKFKNQDFVCQGDYKAWARYANSLRLRAALRVSLNGSLTDKGKSIIKEILENPDKYPLVDNNSKNIFLKNDHSGELNFEGGGGLGDWTSCRMASGSVTDRMLSKGNYRIGADKKHIAGTGTYTPGTDDPRILLLYTMRKGDNTDGAQSNNYTNIIKDNKLENSLFFIGVDLADYFADPGYYDDSGQSEIVQNGFFWQNNNFEHVQMTASEVLFAQAEAYHRGLGVAKNEEKAEAAFIQGVKQSISLYYHWNEINNHDKTSLIPTPSDTEAEAYAKARWSSSVNPNIPYKASDPKLDAILTQKWLHWGIFFPHEGWSQIRSTGLPKLIYPKSGGIIDWVPDRWKYPLTEQSYNPNYPGVEKDTYYGKLFWADPKGMRHSVLNGGTWTDQYGD